MSASSGLSEAKLVSNCCHFGFASMTLDTMGSNDPQMLVFGKRSCIMSVFISSLVIVATANTVLTRVLWTCGGYKLVLLQLRQQLLIVNIPLCLSKHDDVQR